MEKPPKSPVTKVYCQACDRVFGSRGEFDRHLRGHSPAAPCEACPIDTAIDRLLGLFRGRRGRPE